MRFFQAILSSAAFAALVAALEINQYPTAGVVAGTTYTITYSPADDVPTTFILRQGESTNLDTVGTLTTSATGGKFEWTPSKDLANHADYALEIKRGDTVNYSGQFPLTGGSASQASSNSASATHSATPSATPSASSASKSSASASASVSSGSAVSSSASGSASASASPSPSSASNSTVSSATLSRSTASRTPTGSASVPEVTGNAANSLLANPIAAIAGAAAAFVYLA